MRGREPQAEDFDLCPDKLDGLRVIKRSVERAIGAAVFFGTAGLLVAWFVRAPDPQYGDGIVGLIFIGITAYFGAALITGILYGLWQLGGPPTLPIRQFRRLAAYERARRQFEEDELRAKTAFWTGLSGRAFEHELAILYRRLGHTVHETPPTGDAGIDLVIEDEQGRTVVQCKRHKKPIGVGAVRDLYGTLVSTGANRAVLASVSGFTRGTRSFCAGKPIHLLDLDEILAMQERAGTESSKLRHQQRD